MAPSSATTILQIHPFCNCEGCIKKFKKALGKLEDVQLLEMDLETGKFTILTNSKHPLEVIKSAIKKTFPRKKVTLSPEINHAYPLPAAYSNPHNMIVQRNRVIPLETAQGTFSDIANALLTASLAKGLESVECTQTDTFKIHFNHKNQTNPYSLPPTVLHNRHGSNESFPPPLPPPPPPMNSKPSAPPIPTTEYQVYGYPPKFYGL